MRCTSCAFENAAAGKFCSECGAQLNAPIATPVSEKAGERRHLTVLFSDLVGSTEISARLDPEEFRELYQRRRPAYMNADSCIDTYRKTISSVVEEITSALQ